MKILRFLSCALLGALASAQAVVLNADTPTIQLSGNGLWQVEAVKNATLMNSLTGGQNVELSGQQLVLNQAVVSGSAKALDISSSVKYLASDFADAGNVIFGQGVTIDAGAMLVSSLSSKVQDAAGKVLVQNSEGVVLQLQGGTTVTGGTLGQIVNSGITTVTAAGESYFVRKVDVLQVAAGGEATLKNTSTYVESALDIEDGATLVLDNASLVLGNASTPDSRAEFLLNDVNSSQTNHVVVQTGQDATNRLNLAGRPVMNGTIKGTGYLENVRMKGGTLEIGSAGGYGSLAIKDVVSLQNGGASPQWIFHVNAQGDFNFAGANTVGGTNFSQLKVEDYGSHGQGVHVVLNYQNGTVDDLAMKFERGATIRLIDLENGALSGTCYFEYDNLPVLADGLVWYTYELFLTGELVVVDDYLNVMATGLLDDDLYSMPSDNQGSPQAKAQIKLSELEQIALDNQAKDAGRLANSVAAAAAATSAFGNTAMGHVDDVRRWKSNVWFSAVYSSQDVASSGSRAGYENSVFGYAVGADTVVKKYNAVVGAALGKSFGTLHPESGNRYYNAGEIEQEGLQLGMYGRIKVGGQGYEDRGYNVSGFISYGAYDCKSSRAGYVNGDHVIGCWDESAWSMGITVSREYQWQRGIVVTPFAGFEYTTADMEGLREMGYTAFDYVGVQDHKNLAVFVGAGVHRVFPLQRGQSLIPYARLNLGMDIYRQYARVIGSSAVGTVAGEAVHPGRCFLELGFGTDWIISRTWTADAGYMLDVRDAAVEHQLHIGASHSF